MSASWEKPILLTVLVLFGLLTATGIIIDGVPVAVFDAITFNWHSVQIYIDLVIAVAVICAWIYRDARARGRSPWPWIVAAAIVGMFSPLVYLLARTNEPSSP